MLKYQTENIGQSFAFRSRYHQPGYTVLPHIHEYSEILYVKQGVMTMYLNGQKLCVPSEHVAVIFPNQIHEYTAETDCYVWCAVFSNDFLHCFNRLYPDRIPMMPVVDVTECPQLLHKLEASSKEDIVVRTGLLHLLFSMLIQHTEFIPRSGSDDSLYNSALNYISANFRSEFTLSDMAKALGYHEKYLSTELHSLTKMNFRSFLATYRVDHAKRLLRTCEMNISEIALESGFSSINTFNRVFKQITGVTPSEYRKNSADGANP